MKIHTLGAVRGPLRNTPPAPDGGGGGGAPAAPPTPPAPPAPPAGGGDAMVPSARLREETNRREAAEARAARAERLELTVEAFKAFGTTDQEAADQAIANWERLPPEGRGKFSEWAGALKAAPPRWLQGYLPSSPATPPAGTTPPPTTTAPPAPPTTGATGAVPPATGGAGAAPAVGAAHMRALRAEAKQTGDWSKVVAANEAAKKSINA